MDARVSEGARLRAARAAVTPRGVGHVTNVVCAKAQNAELWDADGRRFIDFAAGIAVLNTGHRHPKVIAAVQDQMTRVTHTCFHVAQYPEYIELAGRLNALVPGPSAKKTMFVTTGAEAVENAVKIARAHTGRSSVIAFGGGFHGRTHLTMGLTGKVVPYKAGFGPMPAGIFHARYPSEILGVSVDDSIASIEDILRFAADPKSVAALIVEPVQGEGGFYVAPPEFLRRLRALCDAHGIVLIIDEIQSGMARTGRMFAHEYAEVEADIVTIAKGLAGGFPLSAVTGKAEIMDAPGPGGLGGTFAGSPIGCAAALAVLDVITEEGLLDAASAIGRTVRARLEAFAASKDGRCIGEIRGLGAMAAIELVSEADPNVPDSDLAKRVVASAEERGLIVLSCGVRGNVLRLLPPLTIPQQLLEEGLSLLTEAICAAKAQ